MNLNDADSLLLRHWNEPQRTAGLSRYPAIATIDFVALKRGFTPRRREGISARARGKLGMGLLWAQSRLPRCSQMICIAQSTFVANGPKRTTAEGLDARPLSEIDCFERTSQVGVNWE